MIVPAIRDIQPTLQRFFLPNVVLLTIDFLAQFFQFCRQHWKERRRKVNYSTCARMISLTRVSCNVSRCSMRQFDKLNSLSSKSNRNIIFFEIYIKGSPQGNIFILNPILSTHSSGMYRVESEEIESG